MNEVMVMKAYMVNRLAVMLMQQHEGMSMQEALSMVFQSDTYQKMMDDKTRLYYQSPMYVFSFLEQELKLGRIS
jgi:hypothetical protein